MEIEGEIPVGTRFTLTPTDPGGVARSITCDAESPCQSVIQVEDFTPESFTVSATGPDLDYEQTFAPDYETLQPNGPDCPPHLPGGHDRRGPAVGGAQVEKYFASG